MCIDITLGIVCPCPVAFWMSEPIPTWITDLRNFFYSQSRWKKKPKKKEKQKKSTTVST